MFKVVYVAMEISFFAKNWFSLITTCLCSHYEILFKSNLINTFLARIIFIHKVIMKESTKLFPYIIPLKKKGLSTKSRQCFFQLYVRLLLHSDNMRWSLKIANCKKFTGIKLLKKVELKKKNEFNESYNLMSFMTLAPKHQW